MDTAVLWSPLGVVPGVVPAITVVAVNICPWLWVTAVVVPRDDGLGEFESSDSLQYTTPVCET